MKQLSLIFGFFFALSVSVYAQSEMPAGVKSAFESRFSGAKVDEHYATSDQHFVLFEHQGQAHKAVYDASGSWKETASLVLATDAPESIRTYLKENHSGHIFKDFWKLSTPDKEGFKVTSGALAVYFDASGNFVRTEEVSDELEGLY
ncbi:MAG: hypothetical protein AAF740_07595 [Bacteroidota bacterium]